MDADPNVMKAEAISHLKGEKEADTGAKKRRAASSGGAKVCPPPPFHLRVSPQSSATLPRASKADRSNNAAAACPSLRSKRSRRPR